MLSNFCPPRSRDEAGERLGRVVLALALLCEGEGGGRWVRQVQNEMDSNPIMTWGPTAYVARIDIMVSLAQLYTTRRWREDDRTGQGAAIRAAWNLKFGGNAFFTIFFFIHNHLSYGSCSCNAVQPASFRSIQHTHPCIIRTRYVV